MRVTSDFIVSLVDFEFYLRKIRNLEGEWDGMEASFSPLSSNRIELLFLSLSFFAEIPFDWHFNCAATAAVGAKRIKALCLRE